MVSVEFGNVVKKYGDAVAVDDVSLTIEKGELFFLLGPSGCGKTTCLRMIAGFIMPDSGTVMFDGRDMTRVPPEARNIGMVFQTYALFPHMTVDQNIAYGLRFRKVVAADRKRRVGEMLERTRLEGLGGRYPSELSGGQQQRAALARALVIQPDVLLLDEPLSNLDARLRVEVREEIKRIHNDFKITALYVTHDQEEALSMADRVAVMKSGKIVQVGTPREIYCRPKNAFVAGFVGESNILEGTANVMNGVQGLDTAAGWVKMPHSNKYAGGTKVMISARPEHIKLVAQGDGVEGRVVSVSFLGNSASVAVAMKDGTEISALVPGAAAAIKDGDAVGVILESENVVVLE